MRPHQSLDGAWHWSVDPYRDGKAGFHGGGPGSSSNRFADIVQADVAAREPTALFEFDMQRSPVAHLPGAWIGHSPEMRHYNGLVWYQRTFDLTPPREETMPQSLLWSTTAKSVTESSSAISTAFSPTSSLPLATPRR